MDKAWLSTSYPFSSLFYIDTRADACLKPHHKYFTIIDWVETHTYRHTYIDGYRTPCYENNYIYRSQSMSQCACKTHCCKRNERDGEGEAK
jgi:hypothetical protein